MNADGTPIKDKKGNNYVQYVDQGGKAIDPIIMVILILLRLLVLNSTIIPSLVGMALIQM